MAGADAPRARDRRDAMDADHNHEHEHGHRAVIRAEANGGNVHVEIELSEPGTQPSVRGDAAAHRPGATAGLVCCALHAVGEHVRDRVLKRRGHVFRAHIGVALEGCAHRGLQT